MGIFNKTGLGVERGDTQNSVALEENGENDLIFSLISCLWFSNNVSIIKFK